MPYWRVIRRSCLYLSASWISASGWAQVPPLLSTLGKQTPAQPAPTEADQLPPTNELPRCERPLATISVVDGDGSTGWKDAKLESPSKLLRSLIQRSGCFTLVNRGSGLSITNRDRDIQSNQGMQPGSHVGQSQIRTADYVLVAEVQTSRSTSVSGLGGLLGGMQGSLAGGVSGSNLKAAATLSLTDTSTTETIVVGRGEASRRDLRAGATSSLSAVGGGYENTDVGRVHALAYIDAFKKLVEDARLAKAGQMPAMGSADAPFLPWPPPNPSGIADVTRLFKQTQTLGGMAEQIRSRVSGHGYEKLRHFSVPGGFGVTTDVERIKPDGSPASDRWLVGKRPTTDGFMEYIANLFAGDEGRFRLFAFLVTNQDPVPANYKATQMDIDRWRTSGRLFLSRQMSQAQTLPGTKVWLLVYEFEQSKSKGGKLVAPDQDGLSFSKHAAFVGVR